MPGKRRLRGALLVALLAALCGAALRSAAAPQSLASTPYTGSEHSQVPPPHAFEPVAPSRWERCVAAARDLKDVAEEVWERFLPAALEWKGFVASELERFVSMALEFKNTAPPPVLLGAVAAAGTAAAAVVCALSRSCARRKKRAPAVVANSGALGAEGPRRTLTASDLQDVLEQGLHDIDLQLQGSGAARTTSPDQCDWGVAPQEDAPGPALGDSGPAAKEAKEASQVEAAGVAGHQEWKYSPVNGNPITTRATPEINGAKGAACFKAGAVLNVVEERPGPDGVTFLRLDGDKGWLFDQKPGVGTMCVRCGEAPPREASEAPPAKSGREYQRHATPLRSALTQLLPDCLPVNQIFGADAPRK